MPPLKDLTGKKFNRLLVVGFAFVDNHGKAMWNCLCDCGGTSVVAGGKLMSGSTKSCGCLKTERIAKLKYRHGASRTRIYRIWCAMLARCKCEGKPSQKNHGQRGISVCDEWKDFETFCEWAMANNYRDNLSIDRIDNNGDYCPENCHWATPKQQANNTRRNRMIEYNGETHTLSEWAEITGIKYYTLKQRINNYNWSVEKALTTKVKER